MRANLSDCRSLQGRTRRVHVESPPEKKKAEKPSLKDASTATRQVLRGTRTPGHDLRGVGGGRAIPQFVPTVGRCGRRAVDRQLSLSTTAASHCYGCRSRL